MRPCLEAGSVGNTTPFKSCPTDDLLDAGDGEPGWHRSSIAIDSTDWNCSCLLAFAQMRARNGAQHVPSCAIGGTAPNKPLKIALCRCHTFVSTLFIGKLAKPFAASCHQPKSRLLPPVAWSLRSPRRNTIWTVVGHMRVAKGTRKAYCDSVYRPVCACGMDVIRLPGKSFLSQRSTSGLNHEAEENNHTIGESWNAESAATSIRAAGGPLLANRVCGLDWLRRYRAFQQW